MSYKIQCIYIRDLRTSSPDIPNSVRKTGMYNHCILIPISHGLGHIHTISYCLKLDPNPLHCKPCTAPFISDPSRSRPAFTSDQCVVPRPYPTLRVWPLHPISFAAFCFHYSHYTSCIHMISFNCHSGHCAASVRIFICSFSFLVK